jgi:hypothetical protein
VVEVVVSVLLIVIVAMVFLILVKTVNRLVLLLVVLLVRFVIMLAVVIRSLFLLLVLFMLLWILLLLVFFACANPSLRISCGVLLLILLPLIAHLDMIRWNVRTPEEVIGDIRSQVAANHVCAEKIVEMIEGLTAIELAGLAKALSEKFGVTPMAAMPMGAVAAAPGAAQEAQYPRAPSAPGPSLLEQAFVHLSYLNENPDFGRPSNERLELLGLDPADPASARVFTEWRSRLFGAPVVAIICMDRALSSYLDIGILVQTVCLAAQAFGVDSLIASGFVSHPDILRRELEIPENLNIVIGVGFGYPNPKSIINTYRSPRRTVPCGRRGW